MPQPDTNALVRQHLRQFFTGHACEEHTWPLGRAIQELPRLQVLEFAPGRKTGLWAYATAGAWEGRDDPRLEFLILSPTRTKRMVELLFMAAWYHKTRCLGTGHTLPIGEPWLPGSTCNFFLVSLPYPFGSELEIFNFPEGHGPCHVHVLWLLPISAAEREFKVRQGQEALEQRFDECELKYWVLDRKSVV